MNVYILLGLSILIGVGGQICLKIGAIKNLPFVELLFSPPIILGLSAYAISAVLYILALRVIPLSVAFPSVSISYVIVAFLAHFIWREPFGNQQIIALILILSGIFLLYAKVGGAS